ncbi:hypothetical protein HP456_05925 [Bacillus haikouensis]|uniref:hypothetical protein n=1 Tax=Bacillus haikouensis TaxID=1510468 RepID=UPI001552DC83|nr:hypothetical protein [Bacillus haikouensis]NQD65456.1 hypothetical protein [Bacillus haikouensis]
MIAIHGIPPYPWQSGSKEMYVAEYEIILKDVSKYSVSFQEELRLPDGGLGRYLLNLPQMLMYVNSYIKKRIFTIFTEILL